MWHRNFARGNAALWDFDEPQKNEIYLLNLHFVFVHYLWSFDENIAE